VTIEQITEHEWPSGDSIPLMMITRRIDDLAAALSFEIVDWDEDGLGPMRCCLLRLPSSRVILLCESEHGTTHLGWKGPSVEVDAADAAELGLPTFTEEVRLALRLSSNETFAIWDNPDAWREQAVSAVEAAKSCRPPKSLGD
jgi:hypothetical protein